MNNYKTPKYIKNDLVWIKDITGAYIARVCVTRRQKTYNLNFLFSNNWQRLVWYFEEDLEIYTDIFRELK